MLNLKALHLSISINICSGKSNHLYALRWTFLRFRILPQSQIGANHFNVKMVIFSYHE